jgi:hypothetical protein
MRMPAFIIVALGIGGFVASQATAQDTAQIESRLRQLRDDRKRLEESIVNDRAAIAQKTRLRTEKQAVVDANKVLAGRLAEYERALLVKSQDIDKAGRAYDEACAAAAPVVSILGFPIIRSPQSTIPAVAVRGWEWLISTRLELSREHARIDRELQQSVAVDAEGHKQRFADLVAFSQYAAAAKINGDLATDDVKQLDDEVARLQARIGKNEADSDQKRAAIDRLMRDLQQARNTAIAPPPRVPIPPRQPRLPDNATSPINLWFPRAEDLPKGLKSSVDPREVYIYVLGIDARVPVPRAGWHRLRITVDKVGERFLWDNVKAGGKQAYFRGNIPLPIGEFTATLDLPEVPDIAPRSIKSQMLPLVRRGRNATDWLKVQTDEVAKAKAALTAAKPRDQERLRTDLGTAILAMAAEYLVLGRPAQTISLCQSAAPYLPKKSGLGVSTGFGPADLGRAIEIAAAAAFQAGDAAAYKTYMTDLAALCLLCAREDRSPQMQKQRYHVVGALHDEMARNLLILGAAPDQAKAIVEAGSQHYRKSGDEPRPVDWLPDVALPANP